MKMVATILFGCCLAMLGAGGAYAGSPNGDLITASLPAANAAPLTEAANVLVLQEPTRSAAHGDGFISVDTVVIGCTAGAAAGALAIALPVLTVASSGIGLPASASAIISTAGIGCAVGVVSGLAAIGTAWGLNMMSALGDGGAN